MRSRASLVATARNETVIQKSSSPSPYSLLSCAVIEQAVKDYRHPVDLFNNQHTTTTKMRKCLLKRSAKRFLNGNDLDLWVEIGELEIKPDYIRMKMFRKAS